MLKTRVTLFFFRYIWIETKKMRNQKIAIYGNLLRNLLNIFALK